ncbi:ABC transporter ATP-binding protein [Parenemella sanctibonifatiensis]|uniref:ABC transporter ATP-binding protein n=1 Tax=Parenemella sanctibonifatiensis TaxID=2016505 RepID=A0A255E564_9ACTN|nr:ABC transporter ATP-binding protein [Parenemella sanctibonifatiensis]
MCGAAIAEDDVGLPLGRIGGAGCHDPTLGECNPGLLLVFVLVSKPFVAARIEERFNRLVERVLRRMGWVDTVIGYRGYAHRGRVRILCRVVLQPADMTTAVGLVTERLLARRGFRNFLSAPIGHGEVHVTVGGITRSVRADRGGYVDVALADIDLPAGEAEAEFVTAGSKPVRAPITVVAPEVTMGLVSDIDDTVISTSLPRPLIAAWNSFVVHENARQAVPGMAEMYAEMLHDHDGAPTVYVSTGAWNTAGFLTRFLQHYGFPSGPLLLTDWGPTPAGWWRSGPAHKRACLQRLAEDFPGIRWVLVGDDGQHDPALYGDFASQHPDKVRAIALRELTPTEQVLAHGSPTAYVDAARADHSPVPVVKGPDGFRIWATLSRVLDQRQR